LRNLPGGLQRPHGEAKLRVSCEEATLVLLPRPS
jgi:hypothetical protein